MKSYLKILEIATSLQVEFQLKYADSLNIAAKIYQCDILDRAFIVSDEANAINPLELIAMQLGASPENLEGVSIKDLLSDIATQMENISLRLEDLVDILNQE